MEAQSEHVHVAHTLFKHVFAPTCILGRCLATKISGTGAQAEVYQGRVVGWARILHIGGSAVLLWLSLLTERKTGSLQYSRKSFLV